MTEKLQPPKGTRDILPEDARKLQKIIEVCKCVFEKYGFEPLFTPAFENFELFSAKGGIGKAVRDEIYCFKDKSDRDLALRFEFTASLARFILNNPNVQKPFKRYQIGTVWRYDNPQALRYREFWQADIDIVGSAGLLADVECLAAVCEILDILGFKEYIIRVNNKILVQELLRNFIKEDKIRNALRIIDKLDETDQKRNWVIRELSKLFNPEEDYKVNDLFEILEIKTSLKNWTNLRDKIEDRKLTISDAAAYTRFKNLYELCKEFGIEKRIQIDMSLVRGLDYYDSPFFGLVYEIIIGDSKVSCAGGGKYDNLIKDLGGPNIPATGISLGLDRILEIMKEKKMFEIKRSNTKIYVANVDDSMMNDAIEIVQGLRKNNISSQMNLMQRNLSKQLEYASSLDIPFVLIVGPKELKKRSVKLRDMKSGKEKLIKIKDIVKNIKKLL